MIPVIKGSDADIFYSNLTKINRETQSLPDGPRSEIFKYGKRGNILDFATTEKELNMVIAYFTEQSTGKKWALWCEARLKNLEITWTYGTYDLDSRMGDDSPVLYENGVIQF